MAITLSQIQIDAIKTIAKKEGLTNIEVRTSSGALKGDNYFGIITRIVVVGEVKKLELLMKSSSDEESLRKNLPVRKAFLGETYVYRTIFPAFEAFQKEEKLLEGFHGYAKIYGSSENDPDEFLIFENLKEIGYSMWDRKVPMNEDHIKLVLREYGKLHAVSLAMREKKPEVYKKLVENLQPLFDPSDEKEGDNVITVMKAFLGNGLKAVEGDQVASEGLNRFALEVEKFFFESAKNEEDKLVILHGDAWCNNMLFQYEDFEKKNPSKVCFVDWQLTDCGSPAKDLSYFLCACSPKEVLSSYKEYLRIYHDSVKECLLGLHCDPETVFPFELLERHWQKYSRFGVFMSLTTLKLMLCETDEAPDLGEIVTSDKDVMKGMNFESVNNDRYKQRVIDVVTVAVENNWL